MVAPSIHARRSNASGNPVVKALLFCHAHLNQRKANAVAIPLGLHGVKLDSSPIGGLGESEDFYNLFNFFHPALLEVLIELFSLQNARTKGHSVVRQSAHIQFDFSHTATIATLGLFDAEISQRFIQKTVSIWVFGFGIVPEEHNLVTGILFQRDDTAFGAGYTSRCCYNDSTFCWQFSSPSASSSRVKYNSHKKERRGPVSFRAAETSIELRGSLVLKTMQAGRLHRANGAIPRNLLV
jgi:hypothetical protein